jgi:hypothetical protein
LPSFHNNKKEKKKKPQKSKKKKKYKLFIMLSWPKNTSKGCGHPSF